MKYLTYFAIFVLALTMFHLSACSKTPAKASGTYHALEVSGPSPVHCFVIVNEMSTAVGGNCTYY